MDRQKGDLKIITNAEVHERMKDFHREDINHYSLDKRMGLAEAFTEPACVYNVITDCGNGAWIFCNR